MENGPQTPDSLRIVMPSLSSTFSVAVLLVCSAGLAQAPAEPPTTTVSTELVESRLKQLAEDTQLDEPAKAKARALYEQALRNLDQAKSNRAALEQFKNQTASATADLEKAKTSLSKASEPTPAAPIRTDSTLLQLEQELQGRTALLGEKTENLARLDAEPKRRASRLEEISQTLKATQDELAAIEKQSAAGSQDSPLALANKTAEIARQELLTVTVSMLEQERTAYESTTELLQIERDMAAGEFAAAEAELKRWRELVNERRKKEANVQATEARSAALSANPQLSALAESIANLAEERQVLAGQIDSVSKELDASQKSLAKTSTDFERAKEKVSVVGLSHASGQVLRGERASLPDVRRFRRNTKSRDLMLRDARFNQYKYQDQRLELANLEASANALVAELEGEATESTVSEVRDLLQRKKDYLDGLNGDYDAYSKALLQLNDVERQLIDVSEQYASFIDERVLWIRSTFVFSYRDIRPAVDASSWLVAADNWKTLGKTFIPNNRLQGMVLSLSVLAFCVLGYAQRLVRRSITQLGQSVSRRGFYEFSPTVRTVLLTVVASVMWPGLAAFAGLLLLGSPSDFVRAFGAAMLWTASMWLPLEVARQVCRTKGLAESHLQWPSGLLRAIRRQVQSFLVAGVPLLLLSSILESQTTEPLWSSSLGRAAFVGLLVISAFVLQRMLFAKRGAAQQVRVVSPLPRSLHRTCCISLAISPLLLAVLAVLGYYDTSQVLAIRLFQTACAFCLLALVHALFVRWVLMRRRRLTIEQARQRRSTESDSSASHDPVSIAAVQDAFDEVDLGTGSEQTVRLLRTVGIAAAVAAGWLIWNDVVPALSILRNYPVWPGAKVSFADLSLGLVIVAVTYVAARNVPGLLELTLLNYLPVDTGARFATTTLCRYAIAAGGIALAGRSFGITWSSIQWLIAAMGIGLGFGLQEIFANFISGIILLFERPIRVGDVITLGETTGIVTRIRMRATTVTDWDRKEFVVPNKDLITGRLLNWTLSDQTNRITIPVGVAYGSDTDLARSLLLDMAKEHPLILKDPEPIASFEGFGDSTLNVALRCYLPNLENRLATISDLHSAIDRKFREAKIEIAFPQRDLHVRSIEPPLKTIDQRACDESPIN